MKFLSRRLYEAIIDNKYHYVERGEFSVLYRAFIACPEGGRVTGFKMAEGVLPFVRGLDLTRNDFKVTGRSFFPSILHFDP